MTALKISKKDQYINSIRFDIDAMSEGMAELSIKKTFTFLYQGDVFTKHAASKRLQESVEELNKIFSDKSYKPWK
jgi:hypothetical protein